MPSGDIVYETRLVRCRTCRHGKLSYPKTDIYIGRSLDTYGDYCLAEQSLFRQMIQPGDVVLDVGAHVGAFTLAFSELAGASGKVIAWEPQTFLYQLLSVNLVMNGVENVTAYQECLADAAGTVFMPALSYAQENNYGGLSFEDSAQSKGQPGHFLLKRPLDSIGLRRCNFIKLDVEGMELQVLRGAASLLRACRPCLYFENNIPAKSETLLRFVLEAGYRCYWHPALLFSPENFFGVAENVFGNAGTTNVLALPAERPAKIEGLQEIEDPADWPFQQGAL